MTMRDQQNSDSTGATSTPRTGDDRRTEVKPTDNPVPRSPEPEEDAVRDGEEKLNRVKPY